MLISGPDKYSQPFELESYPGHETSIDNPRHAYSQVGLMYAITSGFKKEVKDRHGGMGRDLWLLHVIAYP